MCEGLSSHLGFIPIHDINSLLYRLYTMRRYVASGG
nr:MAG TPA: La HTH in kinetoplastid DICER domain [Caudoviricetes sp.]DAK80499.1 MAG TPA: La HTH in kinetoplastid DICER domain [Caudoviricetes sp.]